MFLSCSIIQWSSPSSPLQFPFWGFYIHFCINQFDPDQRFPLFSYCLPSLSVPLCQSLSGSLRDVAEDFSSTSSSSSSPSLSSSSCSSSQPDLCSSSVALSPESSLSGCPSPAALPLYNKQGADSCIIRVRVESVSNGNVYKSILVRTMLFG